MGQAYPRTAERHNTIDCGFLDTRLGDRDLRFRTHTSRASADDEKLQKRTGPSVVVSRHCRSALQRAGRTLLDGHFHSLANDAFTIVGSVQDVPQFSRYL
jgi:hypothetical protein